MTAKEKAKELIEKYSPMMYCYMGSGMLSNDYDEKVVRENAIQCAKIAVDEIIANTDMYVGNLNPKWSFWQEVKQELEKM